jgi:hypothetical protein
MLYCWSMLYRLACWSMFCRFHCWSILHRLRYWHMLYGLPGLAWSEVGCSNFMSHTIVLRTPLFIQIITHAMHSRNVVAHSCYGTIQPVEHTPAWQPVQHTPVMKPVQHAPTWQLVQHTPTRQPVEHTSIMQQTQSYGQYRTKESWQQIQPTRFSTVTNYSTIEWNL